MEEYLAEAKRKGLLEIGFADHFPLDLLGFTPETPVTMRGDELPAYLADVALLREQASIPVRLGVEVDYLPGREALTARLLAALPLDYCIGSIHFLDGWDFTNPRYAGRYQAEDTDLLYARYFAMLQGLAESRLFDVVGHLDIIKKFAYFPRGSIEHLVEETCRVLAGAGLCVELNTAGWRAPAGEAYPSELFLRCCLELGIPVTLGSDAHRPEDVGAGLERAVGLLKRLGCREVAIFSGRKRSLRPLEG
jgi:histidinol-phosphatase (PHP family)